MALNYSQAKRIVRERVHPRAQLKKIRGQWSLVLPAELDGNQLEASYCKGGSFEELFATFNRLQLAAYSLPAAAAGVTDLGTAAEALRGPNL